MISVKSNRTKVHQLMAAVIQTHQHLGFLQIETRNLLMLKEDRKGDLYVSAMPLPNGEWDLLLRPSIQHLYNNQPELKCISSSQLSI